MNYLVRSLAVGDNTEVITDGLLLQVLLGEVLWDDAKTKTSETYLKVSLGEIVGGNNVDLIVASGNSDDVTEVVGLTVDLDVFSKVLFLQITQASHQIRSHRS